MTDLYIIRGPWRVHPSMFEGQAAIKYEIDGKRHVVSTETHADLALLRDAITEYLQAVEAKK